MPLHDAEQIGWGRLFVMLLVYALELTLGVFACVAVFHIIDEYNSVLLALNLAAFVVGLVVLLASPKPFADRERNFVCLSLIASLVLSILHTVWQVRVSHEHAEDISPTNEQEFYFQYLTLATLRLVMFVFLTALVLRLVWR